RVGPLVDAVQRLAVALGEQAGHGLVRDDHQLLDQRVRLRLALPPGFCDTTLAVELEDDLGPLDPERAAREPPPAQLLGVRGGALELLPHLLPGAAALRLAVATA